MITLLIAIAVGFGSFLGAHLGADAGWGWSVFFGLLGFGVFQGVAGYLIQRRVKADMERVQNILKRGQKTLEAKVQRWQMRPPGSVQAAQREMMESTKVFVREALEQVETLAKYRLWVPMMDRQIATAKVQLCWQIRDYKTVDALMPKVLLVDPMMVAIKIARLYMQGGDALDEIRKLYEKGVRRTRYNGNVLLAAELSWIQVQRGDADGAFKTLTEALKKSDDATLRRNHELLMNNRVGHFSNSGLGDLWYSLQLEEPKVKMQRARSVYR